MKALIIDSTAERLVIIGVSGTAHKTYLGEVGARRHTGSILVAIDATLSSLGCTAAELDYIGVVVGPGSFTGIRIGVATANAMAFASGAKVVQITSLEPIIYNQDNGLALLDCKHDNYYALARQNGKDSYLSLTAQQADLYTLPKYYITAPNTEGLLAVFNYKVDSRDFVSTAQPFYIKKSSAETQC